METQVKDKGKIIIIVCVAIIICLAVALGVVLLDCTYLI